MMSQANSPERRAAAAAKVITALVIVIVAPLVIGVIVASVVSGRAAHLMEASVVLFQTMALLAGSFIFVFALVYGFNRLARGKTGGRDENRPD